MANTHKKLEIAFTIKHGIVHWGKKHRPNTGESSAVGVDGVDSLPQCGYDNRFICGYCYNGRQRAVHFND